MELTKELLLNKLKELESQFEQAKQNTSALNGAVQFAKHLLQTMEQEIKK